MNKHCFRLIFSKVLGCLIPVAEITRAQRKPGQQPSAAVAEIATTPPVFSLNTLFLSMLVACVPGWAAADILVDPNRPSGTNVISAPNGVPVIEIANPNGNGLSHNRFTEFDVQKPGAIFNNSVVNGQSQLGGAVLLNPNLQREATAILTEVTGNTPSSISGTLEVFGGKADVLIAKSFVDRGYMSTSTSVKAAKNFASFDEGNTLQVVFGASGMPIVSSKYRHENEVLYNAGTQFDFLLDNRNSTGNKAVILSEKGLPADSGHKYEMDLGNTAVTKKVDGEHLTSRAKPNDDAPK